MTSKRANSDERVGAQSPEAVPGGFPRPVRGFPRPGWATLAALVALVGLSSPKLLAASSVNAGMLALRDGLLAETSLVPGTYPLVRVWNPEAVPGMAHPGDVESRSRSGAGARSIRALRRAVALDGQGLPARWALGRAALAVGDTGCAVDALRPLADRVEHQPLLWQDLLVALSYGGSPVESRSRSGDEVLGLYAALARPLGGETILGGETPPLPVGGETVLGGETAPPVTRLVSDTLALAYLDGGGDLTAVEAATKAKQFRPDDLYANDVLRRDALAAGDEGAAAALSQQISNLAIEAVHPADDRLLEYAAQVIPDLLAEGLWGRERTSSVVSFLVWEHAGAGGVERLLERLIERYPAEADWQFYLAELYHRRGDLGRAEAVYRVVLEADPTCATAAFRLGLVNEAFMDRDQAIFWYARYHEMVPDDLLGLAKLVGVSQASGRLEGQWNPEAVSGKGRELESQLDDREAVAKILGLPCDSIELGPNTLPEGDFDQVVGGQPKSWRIADYATGQEATGPRAAFFAGPDSMAAVSSRFAARIDGLWMADPQKGFFGLVAQRDQTRGTYMIETQPQQLYLISGMYRTGGQSDRASVYLGNPQVRLFEGWLSPTDGAWRRFVFAGCHSSTGSEWMQLILRIWGPGQVWFDDVSVKQITTPYEAEACNRLPNTP